MGSSRDILPVVENQPGKKMEQETDTGIMRYPTGPCRNIV